MTEAEAAALVFRLLGARMRSRYELQQALARRGCSDAVGAAVLDDLESRGYVDDAKLAREYCEYRLRDRPLGRVRLERELHKRGLAPLVVSGALEQVFASTDVPGLALEAARSHLAKLQDQPPETARRRLWGFLQRRGFDSDTIRSVVDRLMPPTDAS
ncbi:MAG: regulatory protein RecX [Bacillota bacterium]